MARQPASTSALALPEAPRIQGLQSKEASLPESLQVTVLPNVPPGLNGPPSRVACSANLAIPPQTATAEPELSALSRLHPRPE